LSLFLATIIHIISTQTININLGNLYSASGSGGVNVQTSGTCGSLDCSNSSQYDYCQSNCCVNQSTCACQNPASCLYENQKIVAEGFTVGTTPTSRHPFSVKVSARLEVNLQGSTSNYGRILYFFTWTTLSEPILNITISDINGNELVQFKVENQYTESTSGGAVNSYLPTTTEITNLLAASQWILTVYAPVANLRAETLLSKQLKQISNAVHASSSSCYSYQSVCYNTNSYGNYTANYNSFAATCKQPTCTVGCNIGGCSGCPNDGNCYFCFTCTCPATACPIPLILTCVPPPSQSDPTSYMDACENAYIGLQQTFTITPIVIGSAPVTCSGFNQGYKEVNCSTSCS